MRNIIIVTKVYNVEEDDDTIHIIFVIILDTTDFFFYNCIALLLSLRIPIRTETLPDFTWGIIEQSHDAQIDNCILEGNRNHKVFIIFFQ